MVKCGKCPACQQEKACARSNRIRNNVSSGTIALFITLTYANDYVPYIKKSDLSKEHIYDFDVPVYRNASCRYVYSRSHGLRFKKSSGIEIVDSVFVPTELRSDYSVASLSHLRGLSNDCVGVCLYKDFQDFVKRLRVYLQRVYNYEKRFTYFSCSEYGAHSKRPHFHALLFISKNDEAKFRDAVATCWPYDDYYRKKKNMEVARNAASYVSSYVNSHLGVSSALQVPEFSPQHSYSKGFGVVLDCFSLSTILEKIDQGDLYYYRSKQYDGKSAVAPLPIPAYVLNRYFPKFKGYGRLSPDALQRILLDPERVGFELQSGVQECTYTTNGRTYITYLNHEAIQDSPLYSFTPKETYQIFVRLDNAYRYFHRISGLSRYDFVYYFLAAWRLHSLTIFKDSYEDVEDFSNFYENALEFVNGQVSAPTLSLDVDYQLDPDKRKDILEKHCNMVDLYYKLDKEKKVVNYSMSHRGHHV